MYGAYHQKTHTALRFKSRNRHNSSFTLAIFVGMSYNRQSMDITNLLEQGVNLMMLGMGMVFFILSLLVVTLKIVSTVILKYEPEVVPPSPKTSAPKINKDVAEAITIAVQRFRSK